jgi:hypothetical protein
MGLVKEELVGVVMQREQKQQQKQWQQQKQS